MFFSFVIATALLANVARAGCPDGYSHFAGDDSCLKGVANKENYIVARKLCQDDGGDLVKVTSKAKSDFVYDLIGSGYIWIGVDDILQEGTFTFSDGSDLTSYQPWNNGEPNNYHGREDCGHLINRHQGLWNDMDCGYQMAYACEVANSGCANGYTYFKDADACLKAYTETRSFDEARQVCQSEDADLVIVKDEAMQNFVYQLAGIGHIWLGLSDTKTEGTFEYVDGSPLGSFHPWNNGEPNNYHGAEDCAHLIGKEHGRPNPWNDMACAYKMKFVCQEKKTCSDGYTFYQAGGACLKAHSDLKTFDEARAVCQSEEADLVTITDAAKSDFVYKLAGNGHIWMGLSDRREEGTFEYINGSPLGSYHPWNNGEPNNYHGAEDCAHLIGKEHGRPNPWNDMACAYKMKFVCQEYRKCQDGYTLYKAGDTCLKAYTEKKSFADARKVCQSEHADLVIIADAGKSKFVYDLAGDDHIWMGLSDIKVEGTFEYVNGSPLTSYQPWNKGEPNNYYGREDCAHLIGRQYNIATNWNDMDCGYRMKFVCEESN